MRYILGAMNGIWAEPGTILGPKDITREYLVAVSTDEHGTQLGYMTEQEKMDAFSRIIKGDVRSITEIRLLQAMGELF